MIKMLWNVNARVFFISLKSSTIQHRLIFNVFRSLFRLFILRLHRFQSIFKSLWKPRDFLFALDQFFPNLFLLLLLLLSIRHRISFFCGVLNGFYQIIVVFFSMPHSRRVCFAAYTSSITFISSYTDTQFKRTSRKTNTKSRSSFFFLFLFLFLVFVYSYTT